MEIWIHQPMNVLSWLAWIAFLVSGCSSNNSTDSSGNQDPPPVDDPSLSVDIANRDWALVRIQESMGTQYSVEQEIDFEFTVRFRFDIYEPIGEDVGIVYPRVGGINVCNAYVAAWSIENSKLAVSDREEDGRHCERSIDSAATTFNRVLFQSQPFLILEENELSMRTDANEVLYFHSPSAQ